MSLRALVGAQEVAVAFREFARHFGRGGEVLTRNISYSAGSEETEIRWFPELKIWVVLQPDRMDNRYWCGFGMDDPTDRESLSLTCEINPPREGKNRQCAAVFVRSNNGTIYLAHSGRVGGGRAGVGKASFLEFYGDRTVDRVEWPDKQAWDYIIIGALDDDDFPAEVAEFVRRVAQFKEEAAAAVSR